MKHLFRKASAALSLTTAAVVTFALALPMLWIGSAAAYGQVTARSITIGSSVVSASTTYTVGFTESASGIIKSVDIDFCTTSPIYGDSCTLPTGFSGSSATLSSQTGTSGWTLTQGTAHLVISGSSFNSAAAVSFTIASVTNPSTTGSFYARIYTYAAQSNNYTSVTNPGTVLDFGGIALSTADVVSITAKVFETLSFCVFQTSCGTPASLTLGDSTTGALSTSNAYVNSNAKFTLATNASSGVSVVMRGLTLCRAATLNFTNCPAYTSPSVNTITGTGSTAAALSTGSEQFGMCADKNASSALTVNATYADSVSTNNCAVAGLSTGTYSGTSRFGFNDDSSTGTNSAGGSSVMTSSTPVTSVTGSFIFLGDIATTTDAGIYTTALNYVATGTF